MQIDRLTLKQRTRNGVGEKKQGRIHEPKSRAGGQERRKKLSITDRQTDGQTDRRTEWVIESRARD